MRALLISLLLWMTPCLVLAAEDYYAFDSAAEQHRFEALTTNLRCLVCQNQNIAESNAALAGDLRGEVYKQIVGGKSDQEIIQYLIARYGDYILYRPPLSVRTLGLWFTPFLCLILGVGYLIYYIRREKKSC